MAENVAAACTAFVFLAASIAVSPVASRPAPVSFPLLAFIMGASIVEVAVITVLVLVQGRTLRSLPTLVLGAGFAFAGAAMIPWVLFYPGGGDGAHPSSPQ